MIMTITAAGPLEGAPAGAPPLIPVDGTMTGTIIATGITAVTLGGTMTVDTMTGTAIRTDTAPGAAGIGMMTLTARTGSAQPPTGRTMAPPGRNGPPAAAPEAAGPPPSGRSGSPQRFLFQPEHLPLWAGQPERKPRPPEDPEKTVQPEPARPPASSSRRSAVQLVPIILGLVVIVLAALVIRSMLGGKSGYELEFSTKNIVVGETATATLKGVDSNAAEPEVLWTSSENNVVSVEGEGLECTLTAKSLGSATIIATVEGEKVASGTVTVVDTALGLSPSGEPGRGDHFSGETYTINATVEMEKADMTPATIKWSSNNTSVAEVDSEGVITAREVGNAIIKGVAGEKTVEIAVEVG